MKKIFTLLLVVFISSCSNKAKITITKVEGSPLYENAKLSLDSIYQKDKNNFMFSFEVDNYELGEALGKRLAQVKSMSLVNLFYSICSTSISINS